MSAMMKASKAGDGEGGVALIVALLVVTLLVTITLQFTYTTTIDLKLVRNQSRERKSYYAARGVVALSVAHLQEDLGQAAGAKSTDSLNDSWAGEVDPEEPWGGKFERSIGEVAVEYVIEDEDRKICVNNLIVEKVYLPEEPKEESGDGPPPGPKKEDDKEKKKPPDPEALAKERREVTSELIRGLLVQPPFNFEKEEGKALVESIVDEAPYSSILDLSLVEGITPEHLLGYSDDFGAYPGLVDFLTVYSMGQINLNTAPREILVAIFEPKYEEEAEYYADEILEFRAPPEEEEEDPPVEEEDPPLEEEQLGGIFKSVGDLAQEIPGLEEVFGGPDADDEEKKRGEALKHQLTVRSRFFSVKVTTGETAPRKEFSFVLKRGEKAGEAIPVLIWEERELPPRQEGEEEFP